MTKELFIECIAAIEKQIKYDIKVSENLSEVFPNAFAANLLPENHYLSNALTKVLQVEMNDLNICEHGMSWIEYFMHELDFGRKNNDLKVFQKGKEIPMRNSGQLYDFLKSQKR